MPHPKHRLTQLCTAILALGLAAGVSAQDKSAGGTTATPKTQSGATTTTPSSKQNGAMSSGDRKFVEKAAVGGMAEVELGQLAQQKASSDQVKQFGARMQQDHSKANEELKQLASSKGLQLPASLDKDHQKDKQKLEKLSGAEFDREYMKMMVDDHKDDVDAFEKTAKSGKDADVKSFAAKTLPTLQQHRQLAQTTYDAVKQSKKSASSDTMPVTKPATKPYN
jgi:putative membrane protein